MRVCHCTITDRRVCAKCPNNYTSDNDYYNPKVIGEVVTIIQDLQKIPIDQNPKFCKDCKHHNSGSCNVNQSYDLVTGERKIKVCKDQRELTGECGPQGRLFEAK